MKIACLTFVTVICTINVIACLRQAWVLWRKKIHLCTGRIVAARMASAEECLGGGNPLTMFWPEVEYEYQAGGGMLIGNRISMSSQKTSVRAEVERKLAAYPVAKEVRVFYDSDNNADAYLKNPKKQIINFLFIALGMTVFGGLMNWMIWAVVG